MDITKDVKRFVDIQYNIGYLASQVNKDYTDELSDMISDYVTELFIAKRGKYDERHDIQG